MQTERIYIGTTAAGIEWWAYRPQDVARMEAAFVAQEIKGAAQAAPKGKKMAPKKITYTATDGTVTGTRKSHRIYTHAVIGDVLVNWAKPGRVRKVVSFHGSAVLAAKAMATAQGYEYGPTNCVVVPVTSDQAVAQ